MGFEITVRQTMKIEFLNPYQYTVSLLKEGFRVGLLDLGVVERIQGQIIEILQDLIVRYTRGESSSVRVETAEKLLNSIYYALDACTGGLAGPEDGIALLKTKSMKEIYDKGIELIAECLAETKILYRKIRRKKLGVPLEAYQTSIDEDLPAFFRKYGIVFEAHETMCSMDYPLVFDDMNVQGIFYIKRYLETLDTETTFCRLFRNEDIVKLLGDYGRIYRMDYRKSLINIFEVVINNAVFSVLAGNNAGTLDVSQSQYELLKKRLSGNGSVGINSLIDEAVKRMIKEIGIEDRKLIDYIQRYKPMLVERLLIAIKNDSLENLIVMEADDDLLVAGVFFEEGSRMSDQDFRSMVDRIMECGNVTEKNAIIRSSIQSIEDFLDLLNADCLFEDEFMAVFGALNDMELEALGRMVFFEELRDGVEGFAVIVGNEKKMDREWESYFRRFIEGLGGDRIEGIERLMNGMEGSKVGQNHSPHPPVPSPP